MIGPSAHALARMRGMPEYAAMVARIDAGEPEPEPPQHAATQAQVVALQEWYAALPEPVRVAARDCPLRVVEPMRGCCASNATVCRGGPRDGQVVDVAGCAACKAGDGPR